MASEFEADRRKFLSATDDIKIFHYSSDPKPWVRTLEDRYSAFSDEEWKREVQNTFAGYRGWVEKDPSERKYLGVESGEALPDVPEWAVEATDKVTSMALKEWDKTYQDLALYLEEP